MTSASQDKNHYISTTSFYTNQRLERTPANRSVASAYSDNYTPSFMPSDVLHVEAGYVDFGAG